MEKECNFEKFGFEKPDFECELLKKDKFDYIFGFVGDNCLLWLESGKCFMATHSNEQDMPEYNLTPIKKEWYEDADNFPEVVKNDDGRIELAIGFDKNRHIFLFRGDDYSNICNGWRKIFSIERFTSDLTVSDLKELQSKYKL